jgi:hypothetical protein
MTEKEPEVTHVDMAAATRKLIIETDFAIPNKMAKHFVAIDEWLEAIVNGELVVEEKDHDASGEHNP